MLILFIFTASVFLHAQNNPYFEEQGGAGIRIAVLRPAGEGLSAGEEWLLRLVQSTLTGDFGNYSAMTVLDRQNLDAILNEQMESYSGYYSESDYIELGNLTNTQYITAGSLIKTGGGYILEMSVSDAEKGERIASFPPKNCSLDDLQSTAIMKEIAASLLEQLGVKLTELGKTALKASISSVPPAAAGESARGEAETMVSTENGRRISFREYLEETADDLYMLGDINSAFSYYKNLAYYYPGYYKGWLGIVRCYSGDYTNFNFIDSEMYMERVSITAQSDAEKAEAAVAQTVFNMQWPEIVLLRERQKIEEARRREDNFHRMAFKTEGNTLVEYRRSSSEEVIIPPEITVIGTVGPFFEGSDYTEGWRIATELGIPIVDEHYYQSPAWYIYNQDYYDRYDRNKSKVYLGEYAAHVPGRKRNLEAALAEALYLTALERNGDVVVMSSYAPLLAKEGYTQWNPDLIYFNNMEVKPTVSYQVQKLFGHNSGDEYIPQVITFSNNRQDVQKRIAVSLVRDTKTNDWILKFVNMLPVEVSTTFDWSELQIAKGDVIKTVLYGNPENGGMLPEQTSCTIKEVEQINLLPYSFTMVRVKVQ